MLSLSSLAVQARSAVLAGPELGTYGIYGESFAALIILTLFIAGERLLTVAVLKASAATSNERQRKREGCIFARGQCLGAVLPSVHWIARDGNTPLGTHHQKPPPQNLQRERQRHTKAGSRMFGQCRQSGWPGRRSQSRNCGEAASPVPRALENPTTGANARVLAWSRRGRG